MKTVLISILMISFTLVSAGKGKSLNRVENLKSIHNTTGGDAQEQSLIRLQNKVIAGIETSVHPSFTADNDFMINTLVNFRVGYRMKQHVLTGSLGVEFTDEMFMPLTADYKYYLTYTEKWSPFVYGQAGYSWHLKRNINSSYHTSNYKQIDPGMMASIGIGYSVTTSLNEFYFSVGYAYRDYVEVKPSGSNKTESTDKTMNGFSLTVGFNF